MFSQVLSSATFGVNAYLVRVETNIERTVHKFFIVGLPDNAVKESSERVFAAIKAGALGYLLKDSLPKDLLQGIRDVHRGELAIQAAIAHKLMRELQRSARLSSEVALTQEPLTEREVEVLGLVARGLSNQEIAKRLEISERTARTHVSNILDKLHLANRTQAALYALREGLTRPDGS